MACVGAADAGHAPHPVPGRRAGHDRGGPADGRGRQRHDRELRRGPALGEHAAVRVRGGAADADEGEPEQPPAAGDLDRGGRELLRRRAGECERGRGVD